MKLLTIKLDDTSGPIYRQGKTSLEKAIRQGILRAGDQLPSARTLAEQLQVNRHTVRVAYEELLAEGWIRAEERIGYFVADDFPQENGIARNTVQASGPGLLWEQLHRKGKAHSRLGRVEEMNLAAFPYNLQSSVPDLRLFPVQELKSCFSRALRQLTSHLDYHGARGDPLLLECLSDLLRQQRQLGTQELILTQGSQEAIFMTASLLLKPGSVVAVEEKGYQPAWQCFRHFGAELMPIRLDGEGLVPEDLERKLQEGRIDLLYLTPLHQYPTTVTLTPARRARIMNLLRDFRVPLLEDDYDHDVHFDSLPPLPMAAQDTERLVIYVSTLSKLIFPGARLGFMAVPPESLPWFLEMKAYTSRVNETLASRAVALWIQDGGLGRHLRRLRRIYRERRDHLVEYLSNRGFFRDHCAFEAPQGGMNLWLDIGRNPQDIVEKAREAGLLLSGEHLYVTPERRPEARHLRLGYAAHDEREMKKALALLQKILAL
ncbi:aminotransferase-like domain-containing protein [Oligoflexus tunisiensis]|uniref:aminotransferase-like domain-containing protein n=1 Tax=Oligoflexus tunisiensis TaxID=708132 RepID=UPI000B147570|nr:PLP-dependent aminotransferase family protein [Oligoflexus tunisiensis]